MSHRLSQVDFSRLPVKGRQAAIMQKYAPAVEFYAFGDMSLRCVTDGLGQVLRCCLRICCGSLSGYLKRNCREEMERHRRMVEAAAPGGDRKRNNATKGKAAI